MSDGGDDIDEFHHALRLIERLKQLQVNKENTEGNVILVGLEFCDHLFQLVGEVLHVLKSL